MIETLLRVLAVSAVVVETYTLDSGAVQRRAGLYTPGIGVWGWTEWRTTVGG